MLQQKASPEAIRRFEELARVQARQLAELNPPSVVKTLETVDFHKGLPGSEPAASEGKEKILLKVQDNAGSSRSIRIFKVSN